MEAPSRPISKSDLRPVETNPESENQPVAMNRFFGI
jgi:hypothetical protein